MCIRDRSTTKERVRSVQSQDVYPHVYDSFNKAKQTSGMLTFVCVCVHALGPIGRHPVLGDASLTKQVKGIVCIQAEKHYQITKFEILFEILNTISIFTLLDHKLKIFSI